MFEFTEKGIKYETMEHAGHLELNAAAILPRDFVCTAVRVVAEHPAELMISNLKYGEETILRAAMSLSIIQMFAEALAKKLTMPLAKGTRIHFTINNTNKGPLAYCIWLDGTWS